MPVEIEAKMQIDDFDDLRSRLGRCGARRISLVLEFNVFLDTTGRTLLAADSGLRVRSARDLERGGELITMTFKGALQPGALKRREEREIRAECFDDALALLAGLGFLPTLRFEKRRETWRLDGCSIELDEVAKLGKFVEIEADSEAKIMSARQRLGLADLPLIQAGYAQLLAAQSATLGCDIRF